MICNDIWSQDRMTFRAAGCELRFLLYKDYSRISTMAGVTAQDRSFIMRLGQKRKAGAEAITPPEKMREQEILEKWPVLDTYAACFVQPVFEDGRQLETWLYSLPRDDRMTLLMWLERLTANAPEGVYGIEDMQLIGVMGMQMRKDLDYTTMTLQQALFLFSAFAATIKPPAQQPAGGH